MSKLIKGLPEAQAKFLLLYSAVKTVRTVDALIAGGYLQNIDGRLTLTEKGKKWVNKNGAQNI